MAHVESIHIAAEKEAPTHAVEAIEALPQQGLVGDRHFKAEPVRNKREITLIEAEAVEALAAEHGIEIAPGEARRQIVTRGIRLNDLVGVEFTLGGVRCLGTMLCNPCETLERLTKPGVRAGLEGRGGLCAQILEQGTIRVGDAIEIRRTS